MKFLSSVWPSCPRSRRKYSGLPRIAPSAGALNRWTGYWTWIHLFSRNGTTAISPLLSSYFYIIFYILTISFQNSSLFPLSSTPLSLSLSSSWVCGGEGRYAYSGRPVVVVDAAINWTATEVFSFPFFKSLYEGVDGNCQFFPYRTEFKSLREVFEMSADRSLLEEGTEPWYVGW